MPNLSIAFDKSLRSVDADGRMHVTKSNISKATVNPYYGKEIPGYQELGLDPEKVYKLLRGPDELAKAAPTFARLPILSEHVPVSAEDSRNDLVVGAIGSDISFDAPYLTADLSFWNNGAIAAIETGVMKELSCAYRYVPIMEPGIFEGQAYDGRMTDIQGNHLALVERGRAGSDVYVSDSQPTDLREFAMSKLMVLMLSALSPKIAADSALPAMVDKKANKKEIKDKCLALDNSMDPDQLDNVIDAVMGVQENPEPTISPAAIADESPIGKIKAMLAGKVDDDTIAAICSLMQPATPAAAADKEEDMKKKDIDTAMDSLRTEFREAHIALTDVRPVVGDLIGMDSADKIYKFALDQMKVDATGVEGVAALKALFKVASKSVEKQPAATIAAMDSAGLTAKFPNANRFKGI